LTRLSTQRLCTCCLLVVPLLLNQEVDELSAQVRLRWKFRAGQQMQLKISQKATTTTSVNNRPLAITSALEMDVDWTVGKLASRGAAEMTQQFSRLAIKFQAPDAEPVEYDSQRDKNPTGQLLRMANRVQPLLDSPFRVTVGARGQITEVLSSPDASQTVNSPRLKRFISAEQLASVLRQSNLVLPEMAVSVGDSWETDSVQVSPLGEVKLTTAYTYKGIQERGGRELALIAVETTLEEAKSPRLPNKKSGRLTRHIQSGEIYFDVQAGYLKSSQVRQERTTEKLYRGQRIETVDQSVTALQITVL